MTEIDLASAALVETKRSKGGVNVVDASPVT